MKLATSSYSFHRFGRGPEGDARPGFPAMIETCARLGLDGIELLGLHFESTEWKHLNALKPEVLEAQKRHTYSAIVFSEVASVAISTAR